MENGSGYLKQILVGPKKVISEIVYLYIYHKLFLFVL